MASVYQWDIKRLQFLRQQAICFQIAHGHACTSPVYCPHKNHIYAEELEL
jgi:hypothetical protein